MRFFISIIFIFNFVLCLFSEPYTLTDSIDYKTIHKNINHQFFKIEMMNDFNPFFNSHPTDDNYTLGESIFLRLKKKLSPDYLDVAIKSDLYTDYQKDKNYMNGIRLIQPQYFIEISYTSIYYQHFIPKYKCFISVGGGIGVNNKKKSIGGLALYMQGGKDGKGGYHGLLNNNPGQDNLPSGNIDPLFFFSPSVTKYYSINSLNNLKNKPYLKLQTGIRIGNKQIGSNAFLHTKADLPIVQFIHKQSNIFLLTLILQNDITYHNNGFLLTPEFGLENQFYFLTLGFTSIFNIGKQNISIYKYVDNVPLMRLYLNLNF